ncbi:hypothetical protein NP493_619g02036 [Ridgeia piscesae]|uniref:EGF-like domain-containing protein n=1 Tax=Ridgeia piscesae TaxID=27915 RepID=A0AAD9NP08_RIDPI|nr:hypothetical protein NP493_619g02036 [Ridgeia piscesae]
MLCQNGATCSNTTTGYNCTCLPIHIGTHCERLKNCSEVACENGGTCTDVSTGGMTCQCVLGYTGQLCERT